MDTTKHPNAWFIIALLVLLAVVMLIIIKHYNAGREQQQKNYQSAEIRISIKQIQIDNYSSRKRIFVL